MGSPGRDRAGRARPTVVGPIIGPAVVVPVGPIVTLPPVFAAPSWFAPVAVPRRLTDLPDAQSFIAPGLSGLYAALAANGPGDAPVALAPYTPYGSPDTPADPERYNIGQIVVKLVQAANVRLDGTRLATTRGARDRLARAAIGQADLRQHVADLNAVLDANKAAIGRAAPQVEPEQLTLLRRRAERESGTEMPDPNLFFFVHTQRPRAKAATALLAALRRSPVVEAAYFQPIPFDATDIAPTTTIDVTPQQGYFRPAPGGVDVDFARRFTGGRGEGVRIVDIEGGWTLDHEDLPAASFGYGVNFGFIDGSHGTAVLGELVAQENGFGAVGVVPSSMFGVSSFTNIDPLIPWQTYFYSVANTLLSAGHFLGAGDIALIEQHFPNLFAGTEPAPCNPSQFGYVAVETAPYEHAAIMMMTLAGVIVVEPAGNGQVMVSPTSPLDSGAIVVGASNNDLTPACFTNFGQPRVDVHAWGGFIGTLGGGDGDPALMANGPDPRQFYTRTFGGTSGASPIVVGAAALVQSTRAARGLDKLTPLQMRALLVATGTPQAPATIARGIGPLPNLAAAIATYIPDAAAFVRQTAAPAATAVGSIFSQSVTFGNTGAQPWVGATMAVTSADDGTFPWGTIAFSLGSAAAPVMPGDEITCVFTLHAPAQPGTYTLTYRLTTAAGVTLAFSPRQTIAVTGTGPNTLFDNATITIDQAPGTVRVNTTAAVKVTARNTGSTTWTAGSYLLRLARSGRIALPQNTAALTGSVAPGQSRTFSLTIQGAATPGAGGFSVQMSGPGGAFGQSIGKSVQCQP